MPLELYCCLYWMLSSLRAPTLHRSDEAGVSDGAGAAALEAAARLLGVSDVGLEVALTTRAIEARGEHIVKRVDAGVCTRVWVGEKWE